MCNAHQAKRILSPGLFIIILTFLSFSSLSAQNLYSRASGAFNTTSGRWYTDASRTTAYTGVILATHILNIGSGHIITVPSGVTATVAGIVVNDNGTSGTFTFGNAATATNFTVAGDITVNTGGTFNSAATGAAHVLTVGSTLTGGNIINNNIFNLGANTTLTFSNASSKTISGTGTYTLNNVTLSTTLSSDVNVTSSLLINGILNFSATGLLIVDANSNITLGSAATITGFSSTRYIQVDGSTGSNSQLIKTSINNVSSWQIVFPIGTSTGGYSPLDLTTAGGASMANNPTANSTLAVKAIYGASIQGQMRRQFRMAVAGNAVATTFSNGDFFYNTSSDISTGDVQANYNTRWLLSVASGTWLNNISGTAPGTVSSGSLYYFTAGTNQSLGNGTYYYAIGNSTAFTNVWYSYQTGVWSDPDIWTLDPSGTTLYNPLNQPPSPGDQVVILNGFKVTTDVNNLTLSTTTIQGGATLDMVATTGHTLGTVSGAGLLRVNGIALPTGTYTSFVAPGTGGTIEYYGAAAGSFTLPTGQLAYNNLILSNSTNFNVTFVMAPTSTLTVNGTMDVKQTGGTGTVTWQINDATTTVRTINLVGDLTVSTSGKITVGTGAASTGHALTLYGNFLNNGIVQFFDPTSTFFTNANYTSGATRTTATKGFTVNVTCAGLTDKVFTLNGQTDFYRLIINKGTGQQAMLTINSSNTANFRLFGPNNKDNGVANGTSVSANALSIQNGTLQLTGSINIPSLVEGHDTTDYGDGFPIPQNGALWINGANVTIQVTNTTDTNDNGRQIYVYGLFRITNGTVNMGYSRGLLGGSAGVFFMEGGTLHTWQIRTTYLGSNNRFSYIQTGGTVNVGTTISTGPSVPAFPRFALPFTQCSFQMDGSAVLNVGTPIPGTPATSTGIGGGIFIKAATSNIQVTGGTVNVILPATNDNFTITSTAPFYNMNISKAGSAGTSTAYLNEMYFNDSDGTTSPDYLAAQPLIILNDLTLITGNLPSLTCVNPTNSQNVTVGGNLTIQSGTTLTPGANTITFNGTGAQAWTHNGTITSLSDVVVNKSAGTLTLAGSQTFPTITGATIGLTISAGTLDDGGKTITVTGELSNSGTHKGTGVIVHNNAAAATIDGSGTFGNLTIQTNFTVGLTGAQKVTGNLRLLNANTTLNIGSYNLTVNGNIYSDAGTGVAFTNTQRIQTAGLPNDDGLTRLPASGIDLLFPVGTSNASALYTPVTINVTASATGTITLNPVVGAHPNVTTVNQSVRYYWRVISAGFSGISSVLHKSYTYYNAVKDGVSASYRPARYDQGSLPATPPSWSYGPTYNATAAPGATTIPDFNTSTGWTGISTTKIDGEYTAGLSTAFGAVSVYYSRVTGSWSAASTWSLASVGGVANAPGSPCSTCPVVLGDGNTNNHTISIDVNNVSCGSVVISQSSTLDCGTFSGLNFGVNSRGSVSGTGTIRISSTVSPAAFPAGDFSDFLGVNGGTVEWYGNTAYNIPSSGPAPQNLSLASYCNLKVSPGAGIIFSLPNLNLNIYNTFTLSGASSLSQLNTPTATTRLVTVNGSLLVTSGILNISKAASTNFIVNGNTIISSTGKLTVENTSGARTHTFTTSGDFTNNGTVLFKSTAGSEVVNLTFTGASNSSLTGTNGSAATTLNLLNVNKGTDQSSALTLDVAGTVTALTDNWLTLQNGTMNFNKPSQTFTLMSSTTTPFSIPGSAKLKVQSGTVNITTVNNSASDLNLSGALEVAGGTVNIGSTANTINNDIEYSSAGVPQIIVSAGALNINGAIRRPTTTLSGSLDYNQSGGTVTLYGLNCNVAPNNTRGVFEIENNTGSKYTSTGGSLVISRTTAGTSFADVYINPESSSVASASSIVLGISGTTQTIGINIAPVVGSMLVNSNTTGKLQSSTLTTAGTLTINTAATLSTNSLDVTIGGNLAINGTGTYDGTMGSGNTTTFNGAGLQTGVLSSTSTFLNMTVNKPTGTVSLSGTSPTITNLSILSGILDLGSLDITVTGDITNNSSQIGSGKILLAGAATVTTHTITSGSGSFTNLTLTGLATTKTVTVNGDVTVNGILNFATTNRYLNIGSNALRFGPASSVTGAGNTAFVKTNGVSSDLGVVKNWPSSGTFTYPLGTRTNYTPVTLTLNLNAGGAGDLTVIPVDDRHPTANTGSSEQILNYYWIITRGTTLSYTTSGSHIYSYPAALMGGAGGTLTAGYLDITKETPGWVTSGHGGTANTTAMTFTNLLSTNMPKADSTFHYSVGTVNTLPNPILPVYSRGTGGAWNDPNSWTLSSSGSGPVWGPIPYGNSVVILAGSTINIDASGRKAFITRIEGTLVVPSNKVGHSLGILKGTGTLKTSTSTLPAGAYAIFVSAAGGTIEYTGSINMNNRSTYNNLAVSGGGVITMTNTDLTLNGSVTIGAGTTLNNAANNRNITMAGNWTNNGGTFTTGTGTTVTFNGSANKIIAGATPFNNLVVSKPGANLTLSGTGPTTINNVLTLTNGNIISVTANKLTLPLGATISGGSAASYIAGPVVKYMAASSSFNFPLGAAAVSKYRPASLGNTNVAGNWTLEYVGNDPNALYPRAMINPGSNMIRISMFEYWNITPAVTPNIADLTITYNTGSYIPPNIGNVANLKLAHWDGTKWDLPLTTGGALTQSGDNLTGTLAITRVNSFSPFTFGSLDADSPLPVKWSSVSAMRSDNSVIVSWSTAQEWNNNHFEIERSTDGKTFYAIGTKLAAGNSSSVMRYQFVDHEVSASTEYYYRIKQVDNDNLFDYSHVVVVPGEGVQGRHWMAMPNPVNDQQQFHIEPANQSADAASTVHATVFTSDGVVVFDGEDSLDGLNAQLDTVVHSMKAGIYLIKLSDGTYRESFKIARY